MKEKREFSQPQLASCWPDLPPSVPGHGVMGLRWENGRVGEADRTKKRSTLATALPSPLGEAQDKARDCSVGRGLHATTGMTSQEDDVVPWLNDDPFDDYYSEFFAQVPGADLNSPFATVPDGGILSSYGQEERDAHVLEDGNVPTAPAGCSKRSRKRNSHTCIRFNESDPTMGTIGDLPTRVESLGLTSSKLMQRDKGEANSINFGHFRRPVALVKPNLQFVDRMSGGDKASIAANNDPIVPAFHGQLTPVASKAGLKLCAQPPPPESASLRHLEAIPREDAAKNSRNHNAIMNSTGTGVRLMDNAGHWRGPTSFTVGEGMEINSRNHNNIMNTATGLRLPDNVRRRRGPTSFAAGEGMEMHEAGKHPEPVLAVPSMCSANGAGGASSDVESRVKRKSQGAEDSSEFVEDPDDDSMCGIQHLTTRGTRAKRRRATEVSNSSEKSREDRINEKMRALQRLVPNCAKVDSASTLDEAMEYMKTLQMQVQIMSMYSGMCVLPMMLPPGMQHTGVPRAFPFAPTDIGIGICGGLGFGMGMLDMSGSPGMPVPPMQGPLYPRASIPVTAGFPRMPSSTHLQMFGLAPGHAAPGMPHSAPLIPLVGMSEKVNPAPEAPGPEASPLQIGSQPPDVGGNEAMNNKDEFG